MHFVVLGEWNPPGIPESGQSDRFLPGKIIEIIEHVGYSIRYRKISFLVYLGGSSVSNAGRFFIHPADL